MVTGSHRRVIRTPLIENECELFPQLPNITVKTRTHRQDSRLTLTGVAQGGAALACRGPPATIRQTVIKCQRAGGAVGRRNRRLSERPANSRERSIFAPEAAGGGRLLDYCRMGNKVSGSPIVVGSTIARWTLRTDRRQWRTSRRNRVQAYRLSPQPRCVRHGATSGRLPLAGVVCPRTHRCHAARARRAVLRPPPGRGVVPLA